jgi:hypothetical protein
LRKVWEENREFQTMMFAQLRADIHNSSEMLQRRDKRRWTAQDFGAVETKPQVKYPGIKDPKVFQMRIISQFGPGESVIKKMQGTGQPMPKRA